MSSDEIVIRALLPRDWPQVAAIYRQGIATGNATFETEPPNWEDFHRRHLPFARLVALEASKWSAGLH